jgi:hypothetical protein
VKTQLRQDDCIDLCQADPEYWHSSTGRWFVHLRRIIPPDARAMCATTGRHAGSHHK